MIAVTCSGIVVSLLVGCAQVALNTSILTTDETRRQYVTSPRDCDVDVDVHEGQGGIRTECAARGAVTLPHQEQQAWLFPRKIIPALAGAEPHGWPPRLPRPPASTLPDSRVARRRGCRAAPPPANNPDR